MPDIVPKMGFSAANITIILMLAATVAGAGMAYQSILSVDKSQDNRMDDINRDRQSQRQLMLDKLADNRREMQQLAQDTRSRFETDERNVLAAQTTVTTTASNLNDRLTRIEAKLEFLVQASTSPAQRR
jgi:hypothetical protein